MEKTKYIEHYFNSYMHYLYFFYYEFNKHTKKDDDQVEKELENIDRDLVIMAISFNLLHFHKDKIIERLKSEAYEHSFLIFKQHNKSNSFKNFKKELLLQKTKNLFFPKNTYKLTQNEKDKFFGILENDENYYEEIAEIEF